MCLTALFINSPPLREGNAAERLHNSTATAWKWLNQSSAFPPSHAPEILIIFNILFDFSLRNKKSSEILFKLDVLGYAIKVGQN